MKNNSERPDGENIPDPDSSSITELRNHPDNHWTLRNRLIRRTTRNSTLSVLASFVSVVLALYAVYNTTTTQRDLKEIDLRQNFQKRYDDLVSETKLTVVTDDQTKLYYKRFWDLGFEEYQYCRAGMIDPEIYATWMGARRLDMKRNEQVGTMNFKMGWDITSQFLLQHDFEQRHDYKDFVVFMQDVFDGKKQTCR